LDLKIVPRSEAKERGLKKYFTGKPCKHGHTCERVTLSGACLECYRNYPCVKEAKRNYKKTEKGRESDLRYENSEKGRSKRKDRVTSLAYKEQRRAHKIEKLKDPLRRISKNLRNRLNLAFKAQRVIKSDRTFNLTGCTFRDLVGHLESLFHPGMTVANYGEWEIDHITPVSFFDDLSDVKQQKRCFHYTNLQPLWKVDHRIKSSAERRLACSNY